MKLDGEVLRYLSRDEFRVLTSIELGMRNHELLPSAMIGRIAGMKSGAALKIVKELHKNKLVYHENKRYDGYKLTYLGYDYLALKAYVNRGLISGLGRRIGVGKEADIYECCNEAGERLVLKIHRLGRISFRQIKNKRDYLLHRQSASWLYMSRLAAQREFAFLKALYDHEFPVPTPIDQNRHTILMHYIDATPFLSVRTLRQPMKIYSTLMNLIVRLAEHGLIHGDFNEFNLLYNEETEKLTFIDFPQIVSTNHRNAKMYFDRDVQCIRTYFKKRFGLECEEYPEFFVDTKRKMGLDEQLKASGVDATPEELEEFQKLMEDQREKEIRAEGENEEEEEEEEDEEELVKRLEADGEAEPEEDETNPAEEEADKQEEEDEEEEEDESEDEEDEKERARKEKFAARMARKEERLRANKAKNDRKAARGKDKTNKKIEDEKAAEEKEIDAEQPEEDEEDPQLNELDDRELDAALAARMELVTQIRSKLKASKLKINQLPSAQQMAKASRNTVKSKAKAQIRAAISQDSGY